MIHSINIALHVIAGTIALVIGLIALWYYQRPLQHKRFGRVFLYLVAVVVITGFTGWFFFRSNPFLLMLTLLSGYVGYAGWRTIRLRKQRGSITDAVIALVVLGIGVFYLLWLLKSDAIWSPTVIYSTLVSLIIVTVYDLIKILWLHSRLKEWWLYEHIYKMLSAFSALLSAFTGTVLPDNFKPYSQVVPSMIGVGLIVFFIAQEVNRRKRIIASS